MSFSCDLTGMPCPAIFDLLQGYAAPHITPVKDAKPGDLLGVVLEFNQLTDKHVGYCHVYPVKRFIVLGKTRPEVIHFNDIDED